MWPLIQKAIQTALQALGVANDAKATAQQALAGGGGGGGSTDTLYSANGTLAGNRAVDCDGKTLALNNPFDFKVEEDTTFGSRAKFFYIDCTGSDGKVTIGSAVPGFTTFAELAIDGFGSSIEANVKDAIGDIHDLSLFNGIILRTSGSGDAHLTVNASGIKVGNTGEKVAFLGATPAIRTANANQAVATDPTSTQTLANALRQEMIDRGFWKGSA